MRVTTKFAFSHSFSREFGFEISELKPERKMIQYSVLIDNEHIFAKIEHDMPNDTYWVFSQSNSADIWLESKCFKSIKDAKKHILSSYLLTLKN